MLNNRNKTTMSAQATIFGPHNFCILYKTIFEKNLYIQNIMNDR